MGDSFSKKEREKKKRKKRQDKADLKRQRKADGIKPPEFLYQDKDGNLTLTPPEETKDDIKLEDIVISTPKKTESGPEDYIKEGKVKFFNVEKGYGFIIDKSGASYFVHADNIDGQIKEQDKVIFEAGAGPKGPVALKVRHAPPPAPKKPKQPKASQEPKDAKDPKESTEPKEPTAPKETAEAPKE